jgi:hypothetical protein
VKALNEVLKSHENAGKLAEVEIHFTALESLYEGFSALLSISPQFFTGITIRL